MLCGISSRFQLLSPSERQVAHALLTRPPLSLPSLHPKDQIRSFVRLACVRHAASVRPEPGSNSLKYCINTGLPVSTYFRALFAHSILTYHLFFHRISFEIGFRNYCSVRVLLTSKKSRVPFHRCLIFKVHMLSLSDSSTSIPQSVPFVKNFFKLFSSFFRGSRLPLLRLSAPVGAAARLKRCRYFITLLGVCQHLFSAFLLLFFRFCKRSRVFLCLTF